MPNMKKNVAGMKQASQSARVTKLAGKVNTQKKLASAESKIKKPQPMPRPAPGRGGPKPIKKAR